jgi:hypothetical protein
MRITLELPVLLKAAVSRLELFMERLRWYIFLAVVLFLGNEIVRAIPEWQWVTSIDRVKFVTAGILTGSLLHLLRQRRSLLWQTNRLARTLREPPEIDITSLRRDFLAFKTFGAVLILWFLLSILIYPFSGSNQITSYFQGNFSKSDYSFYLALLQTHATLLGFFIVFLTFVFQLVSYKLAYETSLLPFLVVRARFGPVITINFGFLLLDGLSLIGDQKGHPTLPFRYLSIVGLAFAVLSALFLFRQTVDLLNPDTVETGLSDLIRKEFMEQIEEEQQQIVADHILNEQCTRRGLEYSPLDLAETMPAIRSRRIGVIADIDLTALGRFAANLKAQDPLLNNPPRRAIVLRTLNDLLTTGNHTLARVSPDDDTARTSRLLNRCFKIRES